MIDLESLTQSTKAVAIKAGDFIAREALNFDESKIEIKELNNLVSYVDKGAEEIIVEQLKQLLPEAGFITEEGTASHSNEEYRWVIDPLDGTTNFSHGLPVYSVSIGLALHDEIILGVVYEINRKECFYAWKDGGAYCNGVPIHVSKAKELSETLIATGFPYYQFEKLEAYMNIFTDLVQSTRGLRRMGSAAVDLCYVACGRFDGYFEYNLNPYDVAGGAIIAKEAGATVTMFNGSKTIISGEEILAAPPSIHSALTQTIDTSWK